VPFSSASIYLNTQVIDGYCRGHDASAVISEIFVDTLNFMKRLIYITACVVLGVLLQFLIHAGLEIWYIGLLVSDFPKYGFGFSWNSWLIVHEVGSVVLLIAGFLFGYWQGTHWWRRIYEQRAL